VLRVRQAEEMSNVNAEWRVRVYWGSSALCKCAKVAAQQQCAETEDSVCGERAALVFSKGKQTIHYSSKVSSISESSCSFVKVFEH
jgi:hypothetical protein